MESAPCSFVRLVLAVVVCLCAAHPVLARPVIGIAVTFDQRDAETNKGLRARIARDLSEQHILLSPEEFIAKQFARAFSIMKMFDFRVASPNDAMTMIISIETNGAPVWPAKDAILSFSASAARLTGILFAGRALCGHPHCYPDGGQGFAEFEYYQEIVDRLIDSWPSALRDMFAGITIDPTARYHRGQVLSARDISDLGESSGRQPHAFFQVFVASQLRMVAFCAQRAGDAVGWDQGDRPVPKCQLDTSVHSRLAGTGALTLGRLLR